MPRVGGLMPDNPALPPALLRRIGAALYGEPFQSRLADELEVSPRTMRRWLAGDMPVPPGVGRELYRLVRARYWDFDDISRELETLGILESEDAG